MALLMSRGTVVMQTAPPATPATPPATNGGQPGAAAAEKTTGPDASWAVGGFALVGLGAALSWLLFEWQDPALPEAAVGFSVFAPMYVLAQAIERLMEPFSTMLGATTADGQRATKGEAKAKVESALAVGNLADAAGWQAVLERVRRNRAIIAWGIATFLAMAASGAFGFRLLTMTGLDVAGEIDVIVTGLAIGSGTKPLHDLISNVQKAKDQKTDAPEVATTD